MNNNVIHTNKKALFDYEIESVYEAGIQLTGPEVKAIRMGQCNLKGSYVSLSNNQPIIKGFNISTKTKGSLEDKRDRVVFLKKEDIAIFQGRLKEKGGGIALIPTEVYFKGNLIKLSIALAKGRKSYDKKRVLKERDVLSDTQREIGRF